MIVDFTYPTRVGSKWQVVLVQTDKKGNLHSTPYVDETKDCSFDTYNMICEAYKRQQQKQR